MVSNLKSARDAIEAELSHARQGVAYYTARVEALEIALHQLDNVEEGGDTAPEEVKPRVGRKAGAGRRGRRPHAAGGTNGSRRTASANGTARQRGRQAKGAGGDELPTTGADFWFNLVSDQPQSAVDIANAAATALDIKPEQKTKIQKLKQRVSPALANLIAAQKIKDTGSGRERRFFKES